MSRPLRLVIIAGEVSGDMHAARLVEAIRRKAPDSRFYGIGGDELRKAGMTVWHDAREMAVMGLTEVIARYPFFRRVFFDLLDRTRTLRPDAVIPVDYPGFNLRFSARAHALGFKVLYFICPQVWAWHRSRIPKMAQVVDRLIAIFPFEPEVFRGTGLRVDFVGHPLVDEVQRVLAEPVAPLPWRGEPRSGTPPSRSVAGRRADRTGATRRVIHPAGAVGRRGRHHPGADGRARARPLALGDRRRTDATGPPPGSGRPCRVRHRHA